MIDSAKKIIVLVFLSACFSLLAEEQVLWWRVTEIDNPKSFANLTVTGVDGSPVRMGDLVYQGLSADAVRLRVVGDGIDAYLPLQDPAVDMGGQQSGYLPGDFYAYVGAYSGAAYSFAVELGNESDGQWVIMASTAYYSYGALDSLNHIHDWSDIKANIARPWLPSFVVPEPCSGLLLLVGGGLLALRRRRRV